jgi:hypothetical protein
MWGNTRGRDRITIGWLENVFLRLASPSCSPHPIAFKAKIDTGARTSSLHATDITTFERDTRAFVRFRTAWGNALRSVEAPLLKRKIVKTSEGRRELRFFVESELQVGATWRSVVFSLNDRSGMLYPVLLGRNFLSEGYVVDVSRKFLLERAPDDPPALWLPPVSL